MTVHPSDRVGGNPPQHPHPDGAATGPSGGSTTGVRGVLRYQMSRRERLYLARRRLEQAGCSSTVHESEDQGRTHLALHVFVTSREDCLRVARIVRGSDPQSRRLP